MHAVIFKKLSNGKMNYNGLKKFLSDIDTVPNSDDTTYIETVSLFYRMIFIHHPLFVDCVNEKLKIEELFNKVENDAFDQFNDELQEIFHQLVLFKINSCWYPNPNNDEKFNDYRRHFQLVAYYWEIVQEALISRSIKMVDSLPRKLTELFLSLQFRVLSIFGEIPVEKLENYNKILNNLRHAFDLPRLTGPPLS